MANAAKKKLKSEVDTDELTITADDAPKGLRNEAEVAKSGVTLDNYADSKVEVTVDSVSAALVERLGLKIKLERVGECRFKLTVSQTPDAHWEHSRMGVQTQKGR